MGRNDQGSLPLAGNLYPRHEGDPLFLVEVGHLDDSLILLHVDAVTLLLLVVE